MCLLCAANPSSDRLSSYDLHDGASDGSIGNASSGPITAAGSGAGGSHAPYTWDQIAGYLTDGYWGFNGGVWRAFDLGPGRVITYDTSRLSPLAAAIAEYALDVWAAATGINFVDAGTTASLFTEGADIGGNIATATGISTNTIVTGSIGAVGDADYYRVTLVAGQTYMIGMTQTTGSNVDAVLRLLDSAGAVLQTSDDPSTAAAGEYITFTATTTGTYYISAADYGTRTGGYELSIQGASDLTFNDMDQTGAYAWSDISGNSILQSFININDSWDMLNLNGYMLQTYIHELGHALGLGHAGPYNGDAVWGSDNLYDNDSWSTTIMSYFDQLDNTFDPSDLAYLATIMPADIIAIQNLYGAGSVGYQPGNTVWGPGGNVGGYFQQLLDIWGGVMPANPLIYDGNNFAFTVYDTAGIDTLNFSVFSQNQVINLNPLVRSNVGGVIGNVVIARGVVIENATGGSGNDAITGNAAANVLIGNGGNDTLQGGVGADVLNGGSGVDYAVYWAATSSVSVDLQAGTGSVGEAAGDVLSGVENLAGGAFGDTLQGDGGANRLDGLAGNDLLAGRAGNDTLVGADGNDTLQGGVGADVLNGGSGVDYAVYWAATSAVRVDLQAGTGSLGEAAGDVLSGVENLAGGAFGDTLQGDGGANRLDGLAGNDMLAGRIGNDTLVGADGNDTLQGGIGADVLNGGNGVDYAVYWAATSAVSVDLQAGSGTLGEAAGDVLSGVENLAGGAFGDTLQGDGGANRLDGLAGNDLLAGRAGNDTLVGADGNDTLQGGVGADVLNGGSGVDYAVYWAATSAVSVDLQLGSGSLGEAAGDVLSGVENLAGGAFGDTLQGDGGANRLDGLAGNDLLAGRAGNDTLVGADGNDTLQGGVGADVLNGGSGVDYAVYWAAASAVSVDLQAGTGSVGEAAGDVLSGVENMAGGAFGDTLQGDGGANRLDGLAGNDMLVGRGGNDTLVGADGNDMLIGGQGNDLLIGGNGADVFVFNTALGAAHVDHIADFNAIDDTISLENGIFTALVATGTLAAPLFALGAAATTAGQRIIYNQATGQLFYDSDGVGGAAQVLFATLVPGTAVGASDFPVT